MRFHLFGLANIPTRKENTYEPMTPLVWNMAKMLMDHGHQVVFYGAEGSNPPCTEFVNIVPAELLPTGLVMGPYGVPAAAWKNDFNSHTWQTYISKGREALRQRYRTGDISLISFGTYQRFVAEESTLHCEFMCGYSGIFTHHKVFPSSAWMHYLYGELKMERSPAWGDSVIPHYLDIDEFPYQNQKGDYLLCLGRIDKDKGTDIAIDIANRTGSKIIVAGVDMVTHDIPAWVRNIPGDVEFVGYVNTQRRLELLKNAKALLHPCRWLEPFGMVLIEALACGTPVICSDWGALPEIVEQEVTGFCCRDMAEFVQAVRDVQYIHPLHCRQAVEREYTLDIAYERYMRYFKRLQKLLGGGWYETKGIWRGADVAARVKQLGQDGTVHGVEIGVDRGALSGYLLTEVPNLKLYMIDPWCIFPDDSTYTQSGDLVTARTQAQREEDYQETLRVTEHAADRRRIFRNLASEVVDRCAPECMDFVFIDADHSYEGVKSDIEAWASKVRPGGLLCGHDYGMETWFPNWGVTRAVNEFAASRGKQIELGADWTWFIRM
jgi:glycosyltransferase involved in cell wall biosynthesis